MGLNISVAKSVITAYLSNRLSAANISDLWEINNGNGDLLLEHIKALHHIFGEAIKEIENDGQTS